jgi:hypothetical protein
MAAGPGTPVPQSETPEPRAPRRSEPGSTSGGQTSSARQTYQIVSHLQIIDVNPFPATIRANQTATLSFSLLDQYPDTIVEWKANCALVEITEVSATANMSYQSSSEVTGKNSRSGAAVILSLRPKRATTPLYKEGLDADCYLNAHTTNSNASNSNASAVAHIHIVPTP